MDALTWAGILLCIAQAGTFSGLNLACFTIPRLHLEIEAAGGSTEAATVLRLRRDPNFLLASILWGNVGVNVLLTLLSDSVMAGAAAFVFSTVVITVFGELVPQAWFSRSAVAAAARLAPMIRFYQVLLYPLAKPSALLLDRWLGGEVRAFLRERELKSFLRRHVSESDEIDRLEGLGAINFLSLDDLPVGKVGSPVKPESVVRLPFEGGRPRMPDYEPVCGDPFISLLDAAHRRWVILVDETDEPRLLLDADAFLRAALARAGRPGLAGFTRRPVVVRDPDLALGGAILRLIEERRAGRRTPEDHGVILLWGPERRIITGSDILGRLLEGIPGRGGEVVEPAREGGVV